MVLERAGAEVTVADGPGYGAMMVEPQDARAPLEVFEHVSSWLARGRGGRRAGRGGGRGGRRQACADRRCIRARGASSCSTCSGVQLRERPLFLDGPSGRLFGVLSEPLGGARGLTAVLLNAGPQRRTGPNRMWVEIARRWAAKGVPTLRLDADGIGDSDGDATVLGRVTAFYRPVYVEQARAALEELAGRGLPPRFVALGLCSGAYWSAQAALADERVASVIMLNPRTLVFDEWRHTVRRTRHLRERALMALDLAQGAAWRNQAREASGNGAHARRARGQRTGPARADRVPAPQDRARSRGRAGSSRSKTSSTGYGIAVNTRCCCSPAKRCCAENSRRRGCSIAWIAGQASSSR